MKFNVTQKLSLTLMTQNYTEESKVGTFDEEIEIRDLEQIRNYMG